MPVAIEGLASVPFRCVQLSASFSILEMMLLTRYDNGKFADRVGLILASGVVAHEAFAIPFSAPGYGQASQVCRGGRTDATRNGRACRGL